jgi:ATP-dependent DNA helicase RecQ
VQPTTEPSQTQGEVILQTALARFGHGQLRPGQAEVIADIFLGRPVVAVMPTGAGKSLCYQLPAVVLGGQGGLTLVISPLIALMKDQVDALRTKGISAAALTSAATVDEQRQILDGIVAGVYTLVYIAPERFRSPRFVEALRAVSRNIQLVAIDEAHCISEWGHDFRPDYRRIGEMLRELAPPRIAAFTATATPEVRRDIADQLSLAHPGFHVRGFDRPNLLYAVEQCGGAAAKVDRLLELIRTRDGGVALVYAATRKNAEKYAAELKRAGMRVKVYHAGLDDAVREKVQDTFMAGRLDAIVATNAFGMGVDKSDVRLVVHADIPRSAEAYYQEAGRGGRDGTATRCVILFNHGDVRLQEFLIAASYPSGEQLRAAWKLVNDDPHLGRFDKLAALRAAVPGEASEATIQSALRILERHGLMRKEPGADAYEACRPAPGAYPPLDVDSLARRGELERTKLRTMVEYAYGSRCRRQFLLEYFGDLDWTDRSRRCGSCDTCDDLAHGRSRPSSSADGEAVRKLLGLVEVLDGRFGKMRLSELAAGSDDDPRFSDLEERGCLRGMGGRRVLELLRAMEADGLVEVAGEYPVVSLTARGAKVSRGTEEPTVHLRAAPPKKAQRKKRPPRARRMH